MKCYLSKRAPGPDGACSPLSPAMSGGGSPTLLQGSASQEDFWRRLREKERGSSKEGAGGAGGVLVAHEGSGTGVAHEGTAAA